MDLNWCVCYAKCYPKKYSEMFYFACWPCGEDIRAGVRGARDKAVVQVEHIRLTLVHGLKVSGFKCRLKVVVHPRCLGFKSLCLPVSNFQSMAVNPTAMVPLQREGAGVRPGRRGVVQRADARWSRRAAHRGGCARLRRRRHGNKLITPGAG